jgi:hypoxanthine phosphoribosyltransferase
MNLIYISYEQLTNHCRDFLKTIPNDFDAIIAIPRSGMIPASIFSFHFNIPLITIQELSSGLLRGYGTRLSHINHNIKKVLVFDDSYGNGNAMRDALEKINPYCKENNIEIKTAVVYTTTKDAPIDYMYNILPRPRLFEWNIFNHDYLRTACIDIDGVLCHDPKEYETMDNFKEHAKNAKPLHLIGRPALALVTNRLERYRKETEDWLKRYNIEYQYLFMSPFDTPEERRQNAAQVGYGKMKADVLRKVGGTWFIESSISQATQIKKLSGVPVFCTDENRFI